MKTSVFFAIIFVAITLNLNAATPNKMMVFPSENFLLSLNDAKEENIKIADWMLDVDAFDSELSIMEVKEWMLDETLFSNSEEMVKIESWMLNEKLFEDYKERPLIQDWMLNVSAFSAEQNQEVELAEIENWMTDPDAFCSKE